MSTRFALSIDGVRDGDGLPAIELTPELGSQLRRIRRHDPNPASIAERFNAVTAVESGREFVPDRRRDDYVIKVIVDQLESLDESQIQ